MANEKLEIRQMGGEKTAIEISPTRAIIFLKNPRLRKVFIRQWAKVEDPIEWILNSDDPSIDGLRQTFIQ